MKKLLLYIAACCFALLPVACDKEDSDAVRYGFGEGGIVMTVAAPSTRAINDADLTLAKCTVDIYQRTAGEASAETAETRIRHYEPGDCPKTVKLLAGDYFVSVKWGKQPDDAALDTCFYKGRADFTVTAGATQSVTVDCKPQSAVVAVAFDKSIAEKELSDVRAEVSLPTSEAAYKSLTFTTDDTGYFNMPEGGAELVWSFHAVHPEKGAVEKTGAVKHVLNGKKYALKFRYSDDLPGYVGLDLTIDEKTDNYNDMLIFSPMPVAEGEIFDAGGQNFADKEMTLTMKTVGDATVREVKIYRVGAAAAIRSGYSTRADADSDVLLWHWQCPVSAGAEPTVSGEAKPNVTAALSDDWKSLGITLNPAFFSFPVGETKLRFEFCDSKEAFIEKEALIRVNEGILPVVESDYDLWANSVTLHAVSSKGAPTFKLRLQGTSEWKTIAGVSAGGNEYTATFESVWEESQNTVADVPVYRPDTRWSVFANNTYEIAAEINGHEYCTTFRPVCDQPIPNGNMADASCSCFTTSNENTVFWGSGNNSFAEKLCARDTKSGLYCAHLKSVMAGVGTIKMLASGNLFSGTFVRPSTTGTVSFGQNYDWKARPTALHLKYHATLGSVNQQKHKKTDGTHPANIGEQDRAIFYVAIVDWNKRHDVSSGTKDPIGVWLPDDGANRDEGPIIGYGIFIIDKSTEGSELVDHEIPIYYYDKVTKPSNTYKIVISSATNIYGDYMCGCDSNELWLTDFRWVY